MYVGGFPCGRKSSFWGLRRFLPLRSPLFSCAESREGRAIYFPPFLLSKHKSLIYETIPPFAEPCRAQAHGEGCHFRGILIVPAGQNRSRQALPCPLPGIPVPPANKTHRTEAGFLTFFHAVRPVPERACPPAHAFLFQSGTEALSPFSPLIQVILFLQKEMRQSMQEPCPFLPEAGISTAGGIAPAPGPPPFPLPRGPLPAGKHPPTIPVVRRQRPKNQCRRDPLPIRV